MSDNSIHLSILGMPCACGCVASVENALNKLDGVDKASVNFSDHTANTGGFGCQRNNQIYCISIK
ncbi:heavy-metal-associated domain-containing protein [Candidatus Ruthia endofausta]|uniref:Heavy-metal-associated domain-containing protein n=1 Tax=Candidatus Ruthia endofausta TaxID=2738852 RepID=A0A6N0HN01_9GAMM|nr:heavy metal-associated domain-containing protein [Candidatus Ruthia endofausta]QKQ23714.1 heavy-metal-associated domain-containing protein [Candidatus Ruthia endofausta]